MTHTYTCNECNTYVVCHGENLIACSAKICIGCFMKIVKKAKYLIPLADGSLTWVSYEDLHYVQSKLDEFTE